ncbi:hypothetical protein [Nostoc sp. NMS9]|uniref:hypothetical protein n=1 Tax=Nostoc sp. NMS9 TaxID=2815393 RepID=UPI0025ED2568|nr:hypothetical protein [Nostoc sp. NMS9]
MRVVEGDEGEINSKFKIQNSKLKKKTGKDVALTSRRVGDQGDEGDEGDEGE